jgi:hypothetical protein
MMPVARVSTVVEIAKDGSSLVVTRGVYIFCKIYSH